MSAHPSIGRKEPLLLSLDEIKKDLNRLKKLNAATSKTEIWQVAGHIWESAHWISDMGKDSKIKAEIWKIRKALSELILKTRHSDSIGYQDALTEIADACVSIQARL